MYGSRSLTRTWLVKRSVKAFEMPTARKKWTPRPFHSRPSTWWMHWRGSHRRCRRRWCPPSRFQGSNPNRTAWGRWSGWAEDANSSTKGLQVESAAPTVKQRSCCRSQRHCRKRRRSWAGSSLQGPSHQQGRRWTQSCQLTSLSVIMGMPMSSMAGSVTRTGEFVPYHSVVLLAEEALHVEES